MTEDFDRSGVALLTANPTTIYQVPSEEAGATSLVLSCLAAHVSNSNAASSIQAPWLLLAKITLGFVLALFAVYPCKRTAAPCT